MKRKYLFLVAMLITLATVLNLFAGVAASAEEKATIEAVAFTNGSGTSEDPYQITEAGHLVKINDGLDQHYKLMNDIDLGGAIWTPIGGYAYNTANVQAGAFTGVFDGNDHTISNFKLLDSEVERAATPTSKLGFFGEISNGTVKNVTFANAQMNLTRGSTRHNGIVAGYVIGTSQIKGCAIANNVSITVGGFDALYYLRVGGIAGALDYGHAEITCCKNEADITVTALNDTQTNYYENSMFGIGGIVGALNGTVSNCINAGNISVDRTPSASYKYRHAGGIAALAAYSASESGKKPAEYYIACVLENNINYGNVTMTQTGGDVVDLSPGGILGTNTFSNNSAGTSTRTRALTINGNYNFGTITALADNRGGQIAGRADNAITSTATNYCVSGGKDAYFSNTEDGKTAMAAATDATHTAEELKAMDGYQAIVSAVAEQVPGTTKFCGYQTTAKNAGTNRFDLRLVATLIGDYTEYQNVGFEVSVSVNGGEQVKREQTVKTLYNSIAATNGAGTETETAYSAAELGGNYIFVLVCKGLPAESGPVQFTVTVFHTDANGERVYGKSQTFTVEIPGDTVH